MAVLPAHRDVFLSHRSVNKAFVRKLAVDIESQFHKGNQLLTWVDEAEIRAGQSIIGMVNLGLESSRYGSEPFWLPHFPGTSAQTPSRCELLMELQSVKTRLNELEGQQRTLKGQIAELALQLRQRREPVISSEKVIEAFRHFDELWSELDFAERQYAVRLLVKEVKVLVKKGEKAGQLTIEAWGNRPTPLKIQIADFRSRKLRNQDGWLPEAYSTRIRVH